jgi:hypothetical protein
LRARRARKTLYFYGHDVILVEDMDKTIEEIF